MPAHPYDADYSGALKTAHGADHYWIESWLQEWVAYSTDKPADLLDRREWAHHGWLER
jgi:hypothetical protein